MTGTMVDVLTPQVAQPEAGQDRRAHPAAAAMWREAKTVVVTRVAGPGQLVRVPRLVVPIGDNQLAYRTSSRSAEAGQLARDGRVLVQPGDWRGEPALGSHQRQGHAQLVTAGTLVPYVDAELAAKYRWRAPLARFAHRMARAGVPYGDVVVLVTVSEPSPIPLPPA